MRQFLILAALILSSCQSAHSPEPVYQKRHHKNFSSPKQAIYNRYTLKGNRYTQAQDGAPGKQKEINFREPVPTKEPLSRYGNPAEYRVDGKVYQVLTNTHRYKERGVASWYGTKFHKQRTSSGEPYNMYLMSAAHKTLPLPTYVKVTNLTNGKFAIVKVNDRGPFHSERIIDLSYAAALKLGVFPKGTAAVEVEALVGPKGTGAGEKVRYYIQAGAFAMESSARQLQTKLTHLSKEPVEIEHYQQRYIVRIGPFIDKKAADTLKIKLAHNGVPGAFSVLI